MLIKHRYCNTTAISISDSTVLLPLATPVLDYDYSTQFAVVKKRYPTTVLLTTRSCIVCIAVVVQYYLERESYYVERGTTVLYVVPCGKQKVCSLKSGGYEVYRAIIQYI